jgi:TolA-binding protein
MNAFEKLRPPAPAGARKREITDDDRRFAEAADLYGTLFPDDRDIVTVIYKNGQFFYDYGDYDEATKRFGLILERYPNSQVAGAAGERLLECLNAAKDYENVETWARRLKKTKAFAGKDDQQRLDKLIAGAMMKTAEALAAKQKPGEAAQKFRAVAREYPGTAEAPKALANAGAAFEQAGQPDAAVEAYEELADKYPKSPEAADGLMTAAKLQESVASYARAAVLYEQLAKNYPQSPNAPVALRNAGILRQTLGQLDKAAALYGEYEQRHKGRSEARDVAFQRGMLLADKKDGKGAAVAFADFVKQHPNDERVVEATVREAEAYLRTGEDAKAKDALARALAKWKTSKRDDESTTYAAKARYLQGELMFREYDRIKLAGRPKQLQKALQEKAKLLDDAKKVYLDVVSFKVPEWATAALYRVGQGYTVFAKAMREAKVPRELNPEEQQMYRDELEKFVVVIEDKALDAYRSGYAKALEIGVYNQHTRLLRQALADLDQERYPREAEQRLGLRLGERRPEPTLIEEIRRD